MTTDVLAFIEDPGAANYIMPVIDVLEARGFTVALRTDGKAASYVSRTSIQRDEDAAQLVARLKPRALLVGTSENVQTAGLSLIDHAKRAGIPTIGAVDALGNANKRFRGGSDAPLAHAPDVILVADDVTATAFTRLGYPADAIKITGHPQHDAARTHVQALDAEGRAAVRRRALANAPEEGRPVIVFVGEVSTGVGDEIFKRDAAYTLNGSGKHHLRTEIVIEEFLIAAQTLHPKPYLVLRMHPKNTREELASFIGAFDEISAGGAPRDVIYAADAVVGMSSMLLVEAMLMGRPVLSILPRTQERDWLSELQAGLIPVAGTRADIQKELQRLIADGMQEHTAAHSGTLSAADAAADVVARLLK